MITALFYSGASIAFSVNSLSNLTEDAQEAKPTVFTSDQRILEKFEENFIKTYGNGFFFKKAIQAKLDWLQKGRLVKNSLWDLLALNNVNAQLGGQVRVIFVLGSASKSTLDFFRACFGCQVINTYGLAETSGIVAANQFYDYQASTEPRSVSHSGPPLPCNEIKLVTLEAEGYAVTDLPNPRGELCVRGPNVMKGYYKSLEETAKAIDTEGWLHTGDVVMVLPNGTMQFLQQKSHS